MLPPELKEVTWEDSIRSAHDSINYLEMLYKMSDKVPWSTRAGKIYGPLPDELIMKETDVGSPFNPDFIIALVNSYKSLIGFAEIAREHISFCNMTLNDKGYCVKCNNYRSLFKSMSVERIVAGSEIVDPENF